MTEVNFEELFELSIGGQIFIFIESGSESYINKSYLSPLFKNDFFVNDSPIESLFRLNLLRIAKCLTYFSALKHIWDSLKTFSKIKIEIINNFVQHNSLYSYDIAIHSPNIIPRYSPTYFKIKPNEIYLIKFSQLNVELLLDGFESNCVEYNIKNEYGTIRMESDCRVYCIVQIVKQKFNSKLPLMDDLMRREVLSSIDNITIDFNAILDKKVLDICFLPKNNNTIHELFVNRLSVLSFCVKIVFRTKTTIE